MAKANTITLEAEGNFPFQFFIEKAQPVEKDNGDLILEGIASTTNVDHDTERMSKEALRAMEAAINKEGVPLRVEHSKEDSAIIGRVFKGWVDDRNQLHIQAVLDKNHAVAPILYQAMKDGAKMGLSVGGAVKRAAREFVESLGKVVKTFYDVELQEVSVTPRPANYDSWLVAKSMKKVGESDEPFRKIALYNDFLFENPKLDYLQAFAKSIPDEAWRKVESNKTNMAKTNKEEERDDESTEKAVSRREFNGLVKTIGKLVSLVAKATGTETDAKDQVNPDEDKTTDIGEEAVKADGDAVDQENPDETKPDDVGEKARKAEEEEDEAEKAEEDEEDTEKAKDEEEDETKEKSESETEEADGSDLNGEREEKKRKTRKTRKASESKTEEEEGTDETYELKSMMKTMDQINARLSKTEEEDEEEKEKAEGDEEEEETKEKSVHSLDKLVFKMAKTMAVMAEQMEKSGMRVPAFEKHIVNNLLEDKDFQTELAKHMKMPGFKKSMASGNVYVPTKEGQYLRLNRIDHSEAVEKSEKPGSFKEVFKKQFSSVSSQEE